MRVVLCVGGGGVGKTTLSAALALAGARAGRRAVVVTVDPARRLADALGGRALGDEPRPVAVAGLPAGGALEAAMLDQKQAWDRLVTRHAPSPRAAERLLANRLYRELSRSFAGTHEYLAVEKLGALVDAGRHDLIVLDTPPADHAVDLFDAPARLRGFFDRRILRRLLSAGRSGRFLGRFGRFAVSALEAAVGPAALADAADFFEALAGLLDGLEARGRQLEALLRRPTTALALIVAADDRALAEAEALAARARDLGVVPRAIVVNRVHPPIPAAGRDELAALGVAPWMAENYLAHLRLCAGEARRVERLAAWAADVLLVPDLDEDVHDLEGLERLAALVGTTLAL